MVSKRQAKAQQELESLKAAQQALDDESGEEEVEMQAPKSAFASVSTQQSNLIPSKHVFSWPVMMLKNHRALIQSQRPAL